MSIPKSASPCRLLFRLFFLHKPLMQQQIINTQRTAVPQCFTDIWFCLQSEAVDLNLGMEQEVGFQNSKINPHRGGNETRISSLWSSLKADGSMESVLLSRPQRLCSPTVPCPALQLLGSSAAMALGARCRFSGTHMSRLLLEGQNLLQVNS